MDMVFIKKNWVEVMKDIGKMDYLMVLGKYYMKMVIFLKEILLMENEKVKVNLKINNMSMQVNGKMVK